MKTFVQSVRKFAVPHDDPTAVEYAYNCALMIVCCLFWIPVRKFAVLYDDPTAVEYAFNCALMIVACQLSIRAVNKNNAPLRTIIKSTSSLSHAS
jgi:hypothetical protein